LGEKGGFHILRNKVVRLEAIKNVLRSEIKEHIKGKKQDALLHFLNEKGIDYRTNPKEPNLKIVRSTGETAFQRKLFLKSKVTLKFSSVAPKIVEWQDLELPVILSKAARRRCIDLIGKTGKKLVICELKFKKNTDSTYGSDRPRYAVLETLLYYYQILCNHVYLDKRNVHHKSVTSKFEWGSVLKSSPLLIMAANREYWEYWRKNKNCMSQLMRLLNHVHKKLEISVFLFKTQETGWSEIKLSG